MGFEFNEDAIRQMQDGVNTELRRIVWQVRNEMVGEPADEVQIVLTQRLASGIPGIKPDAAATRQIAEAIEADDLE